MNLRLYLLQRGTAAFMVPLIAIHIVVIFYASRAGLTGAEILARTRSSLAWGIFYCLFVTAASIHASIGARTILLEWGRLSVVASNIASLASGFLLGALGLRAVAAVVLP